MSTRTADSLCVKWGLVGCGWVAHDYVVPALLAAANARLIALCDRDPAALDRVAALAPDALATTDIDALLATPGLDAVYVATPNASHPAIVAMASGASAATRSSAAGSRSQSATRRALAVASSAGTT